MSDFKIGDKVRVTDGPAAYAEYVADISTGSVGVVSRIVCKSVAPIHVIFGEGDETEGWYMQPDHLELVSDPVNSPEHYRSHPSGVECIDITQWMSFTLGNVIKYVWRADSKGDAIEDLKKARWYIQREIDKREKPEWLIVN